MTKPMILQGKVTMTRTEIGYIMTCPLKNLCNNPWNLSNLFLSNLLNHNNLNLSPRPLSSNSSDLRHLQVNLRGKRSIMLKRRPKRRPKLLRPPRLPKRPLPACLKA